tara:strand:- start:4870 stop:5790 length:921 start_codon:yes stop_codon:yes gene_type:complete
MKLSLITPAKNIDEYLISAIKYFIKNKSPDIELIIVLDQLEPQNLLGEIREIEKKNDSLKIFKNDHVGRVTALNYGYKKSIGEIIKCIDSDDILLFDFYSLIDDLMKYDAHCHNAVIGDGNLQKLYTYTFNPTVLNKKYKYIVDNMISSPRWTWSFKRRIGDIIFPIPGNLFAEDFWFTFVIKSNAKEIHHFNKELYIYRQHEGNEWGGVVNFSKRIVHQRSKWLLNEINQLLAHKDILQLSNESMADAIIFHNAILNNKSFFSILFLNLKFIFKLKMILMLYFPKLASIVIRFKWIIDKKRFSNT